MDVVTLDHMLEEMNFSPAMGNISELCLKKTTNPAYNRHLFSFEKNFNYWPWYHWLLENWYISFYIVAAYLVLMVASQRYMRDRPPLDLRRTLFLWNLGLAAFSILATFRVLPELFYLIREFSFHYSVCDMGSVEHHQAVGFWCALFAASKVLELGDTAFIILRKQKLIFLHWYHHITVLVFVWSSGSYPSAIQRWFMAANYLVHSFMYSYYTLKVLRVRVPVMVNMVITSFQLVQMVVGVYVTVYTLLVKQRGETCCVFDEAIAIAVTIYFSYFLLFLNFFIKAYVSNKTLFEMASLNRAGSYPKKCD